MVGAVVGGAFPTANCDMRGLAVGFFRQPVTQKSASYTKVSQLHKSQPVAGGAFPTANCDMRGVAVGVAAGVRQELLAAVPSLYSPTNKGVQKELLWVLFQLQNSPAPGRLHPVACTRSPAPSGN